MPPRRHLRFTFDYISPYAYFAWTEIRLLADRHDCSISFHPVLFAGMLNAWGHKGPAEIPPKRLFTIKQTARRAARMPIPFQWPAAHPFNPLAALRCSLPMVAGDDQVAVIGALFHAIWGHGVDGQDPAALAAALEAAGLDGEALVAQTRQREVKQQLIADTQDAITRGVFGVPTVEVGTELFWGHDSFGDLETWLRGEDPIDADELAALAERLPAGATRT